MLILERRIGNSVRIGDAIRVTIRSIRGRDGVKLAIEAPDDVVIVREELLDRPGLRPRPRRLGKPMRPTSQEEGSHHESRQGCLASAIVRRGA